MIWSPMVELVAAGLLEAQDGDGEGDGGACRDAVEEVSRYKTKRRRGE